MDLKEIRQLFKLLADTDIEEIEIREEDQTVRITRHLGPKGEVVYSSPPPVTYATPPVPSSQQGDVDALPASRESESVASKNAVMSSPMVGTYYHAASPDALPFVSRGDIVKKGQVLCIIEAMKLMNEIESEYSGRIVSILKENASPVEYGETLFIIEPV